MIEYWTKIGDQFPEQWEDINRPSQEQQYKLLETTGLIAMSRAAEDILGPAFNPETKTMDWERVEAQLGMLVSGGLDWRKEGDFRGLTGEAGGGAIRRKIQELLARGTSGYPEDGTESQDAAD